MECIAEKSIKGCDAQQFEAAVDILLRKPHSSNKRAVGAVFIEYDGAVDGLDSCPAVTVGSKYLTTPQTLTRKLLPRDTTVKPHYERVVWDKSRLTFKPLLKSDFFITEKTFSLERERDQLKLLVDAKMATEERVLVRRIYFEPMVKWCTANELTTSDPSLRLVDLQRYNEKYALLKEKHGKALVEGWDESTDPEKFVHEDIAIATYLILLWESEEAKTGKKPSFVDLGCGNGLLVHLLSAEGYRGTGVDLRKRNIWAKLNADLKVETIVPSVDTRYHGFDWLIGNHSDELTPWLPLMAALTSQQTKFFVLPCCPFEFTAKFQRRNMKVSLYRDYLNYVKDVGDRCGFVMEEDRLRIPSTKRICFIGRVKTHSEVEREPRLQEVLNKFKLGHSDEPDAKKQKFVPRATDIKVRNCTKVPKEISDGIINIIVDKCLSTVNNLKKPDGQDWNRGGNVSLGDLARSLPASHLAELKSGCGGLQTFLRNHNYIFIVMGGSVRLRCHATDAHSAGKRSSSGRAEEHRKRKMCWFYENHPQGCPVAKEECFQAHGEDDIRKDA